MVNVVPFPTSLATMMRPPSSWMIVHLMESPRSMQESPPSCLNEVQKAPKVSFILQLIDGVRVGERVELGNTLFKEESNGVAPVFCKSPDTAVDPGGDGNAEDSVHAQIKSK
jgi:hypothetical protein